MTLAAIGDGGLPELERRIPYQGVLEQDGQPQVTGTVSMVFTLSDGTNGDNTWASQPKEVPVFAGRFATTLGETNGLPDWVFETPALELRVSVNGNALDGVQRIHAVPAAHRADVAGRAAGALQLRLQGIEADVAGTEAAVAGLDQRVAVYDSGRFGPAGVMKSYELKVTSGTSETFSVPSGFTGHLYVRGDGGDAAKIFAVGSDGNATVLFTQVVGASGSGASFDFDKIGDLTWQISSASGQGTVWVALVGAAF